MPTLSEAADNLQTSGYRECADVVRKVEKVLKGYEQWENDVFGHDSEWCEVPIELLWSQQIRLIELQQLRNAALGT